MRLRMPLMNTDKTIKLLALLLAIREFFQPLGESTGLITCKNSIIANPAGGGMCRAVRFGRSCARQIF